jgi:hypothetical protein
VIDGASFTEIDFIKAGIGTHGLYPSRGGTKLYIANRGSHKPFGRETCKRDVAPCAEDPRPAKLLNGWDFPCNNGSPGAR